MFIAFGVTIMFANPETKIPVKKENSTYIKSIISQNSYHISQMDLAKCGGCKKSKAAKGKAAKKCGEGKCGKGKCGNGKCGGAKSDTKKPSFMDNDANGDGKVSFEEFNAHASAEFPKKDKNNDGKVTADECGMFDKFNTDGNDFLSKEEFDAGHKAMFEKMDANKDGFVEASELKDMHKCG
ncbi:MAG TPA: hypothetical protein ENK91_05305, partial [Bacteroidetes bacterium]|nr:hypothetical protein [Bacteroidota bacterium]